MRMTQQVDRDPAGKIKVAHAVFIDQMAVLAAHRPHTATGIDRHQRSDRHASSSNFQTLEKEMAARKDRHSPHLIVSRSAVKPRWCRKVQPCAGTRLTAEYLPRQIGRAHV